MKTELHLTEKQCKICKETKPISEFYPLRKVYNTGFCSYCKKCNAEKQNEWNKNNRAKNNQKAKDRRIFHPERELLTRIKRKCKDLNLPCDITEEDLYHDEFCPVLGIKLIRREDGVTTESSPQADRLIPEKGYVKGNVKMISMRANRLKNDGTIEEHEKIVEYMKKFINPNNNTIQDNSLNTNQDNNTNQLNSL